MHTGLLKWLLMYSSDINIMVGKRDTKNPICSYRLCIPLLPCFLFPTMNSSWKNTVFLSMYFMGIAGLSHKPSWAACIPAGDIKIID